MGMIEDIRTGVGAVSDFLGPVRGQGEKLEERKSTAFTRLSEALIATRAYVSNTPDPEDGLPTRGKLSKLWISASNAVRPIDRDLAERCFMKAYGWADPEQFQQREFKELRLELDDIANDIRVIVQEENPQLQVSLKTRKRLLLE